MPGILSPERPFRPTRILGAMAAAVGLAVSLSPIRAAPQPAARPPESKPAPAPDSKAGPNPDARPGARPPWAPDVKKDAPPPLTPEQKKAKLDAWLAAAQREHAMTSLAVGIVGPDGLLWSGAVGVQDAATKRPATTKSLYAIGSVTKVFTAALLVALADAGRLRLDDAVTAHLPAGTAFPSDPRGVTPVTVRHLLTHSSGLPRLPVNLDPVPGDPYNAYSPQALLAGLSKTAAIYPAGSTYLYSNLAFGVAGAVAEQAGGATYESQLRKVILDPLGMTDTVLAVPADKQDRRAAGHPSGTADKPLPKEWELGALAPAGALHSTVEDLARFVAWQFKAGREGCPILRPGSLAEMHRPQHLLPGWQLAVGLGWHVSRKPEFGTIVNHDGAVAGHTSYVAFAPGPKVGVVVLTNCPVNAGKPGEALLALAVELFADRSPVPADPLVEAVAAKMAAEFRVPVQDSLIALFADTFVRDVPPAKLKFLFALHSGNGPCVGWNVDPMGPRTGLVRFSFEDGKQSRNVKVVIGLDGSTDPKIQMLYFK